MLAFPSTLNDKLWGIVLGAIFLTCLNFLRMVSLILLGITQPELLEVAHMAVWQPLMILAALLAWMVWLGRYVNAPQR